MPESKEDRVAVYIDFDNIVISRYDQIHGRGRFLRDRVRAATADSVRANTDLATRLGDATVDIGAVLDFASSFGSIVISRAYADWSIEVNASYKNQLTERAVDLVQLFPTVRSMKNGADIRLAVDVVEDLFRLPDLTHVVIVAGDSDYIALAQRSKRLGRYVVGIGVAGSTSTALAAACDEFADYDALPGISDAEEEQQAAAEPDAVATLEQPDADEPAATSPATTKKQSPQRPSGGGQGRKAKQSAQQAASQLLIRALRLLHAKDDSDWVGSSNVKNQMLRMDPSFQESALGYKNFSDFVKSRGNIAELREEGVQRKLRLRPTQAAQAAQK
ncbi:NYN domain-containing protein [Parafrigoribacterium mesophilum]|uniref:NYN domain-containing protein n=1 Tax=Parafrigoribacterium mesophilum TaxID=433646 RepID=UPI0031FCEB8B